MKTPLLAGGMRVLQLGSQHRRNSRSRGGVSVEQGLRQQLGQGLMSISSPGGATSGEKPCPRGEATSRSELAGSGGGVQCTLLALQLRPGAQRGGPVRGH